MIFGCVSYGTFAMLVTLICVALLGIIVGLSWWLYDELDTGDAFDTKDPDDPFFLNVIEQIHKHRTFFFKKKRTSEENLEEHLKFIWDVLDPPDPHSNEQNEFTASDLVKALGTQPHPDRSYWPQRINDKCLALCAHDDEALTMSDMVTRHRFMTVYKAHISEFVAMGKHKHHTTPLQECIVGVLVDSAKNAMSTVRHAHELETVY